MQARSVSGYAARVAADWPSGRDRLFHDVMTTQLNSAEQMLGGYLHQDWPAEFATVDAAIAAMIDAEPRARRESAAAEIKALLARETDEARLRTILIDGAGCHYDPAGDGSTYGDWLTSLAARLAR